MTAGRDDLFVTGDFELHSGGIAHYKIECDALTDHDLDTLALMVATKATEKAKHATGIQNVWGVPRGGVRFAEALRKYAIDPNGVRLIVDDVLTTGNSMEEAKRNLGWHDAVGIVIFSRTTVVSDWIKPIFQMNMINIADEKSLA